MTPDGPKIVEIGARLGGDNITTHLVPLSTGVDMVECCIRIALGEKPNLEKRINMIEERNKRVELDKRWETSFTRRISICILTYIVVLLFSYLTNKFNNIFLSSLVPVIGFTLSTLSLGIIRKIWFNVINKK